MHKKNTQTFINLKINICIMKKFIDSYRSSKKEEELDKSVNYWICKSCNIKIENQFSECWSCTDK